MTFETPLGYSEQRATAYYGTFVHTPELKVLEVKRNLLVGVDGQGTISFMENCADLEEARAKLSQMETTYELVDVTGGQKSSNTFVFPGFVDTHIHAPQFPNNGIFGSTTLLEWLETYTFPLESSFKDLAVAMDIYTKCIKRTLRNGTTMAAYYATIHTDATNLLCDLALKYGQRALIGKVCMDQNSPDHYLETIDQSKKSTLEVIEHIRNRDAKGELVQPILTPRFAGSCTQELLEWLGQLRKQDDHYIQTHLSENQNEIKWIEAMFPQFEHYTDIYQKTNLLSSKTMLAHCIHLSNEEMQMIKEHKSNVSHCPTSNSSITSGEARVRWLLDNGINVSLGTDCSGGFTPSILEVCKHAHLVSRHLVMKNGNEKDKLSTAEVLFLGTLGGAQSLQMGHIIGSFEVGKKFDAQLIQLDAPNSNVDTFKFQEPQWGQEPVETSFHKFNDLIDKWLFNGDDRNVLKVWVNGRAVVTN